MNELLENYQVSDMVSLHFQRFEWTHDESTIRKKFIDFSKADNDPDPICLRGKYWEFIKEDIEDAVVG